MSYKEMDSLTNKTVKILPSVYSEALSYSDMLGKIVSYLNTTIENVQEFYDTLTAFLERYDNKAREVILELLEAMIADGRFDEYLDVQLSKIDEINAGLTPFKDEITEARNGEESLGNRLTVIVTMITALETALGVTNTNVAGNDGDIDTINGKLLDIGVRIGSNDGKITNIETNIDGVEANVAANAADIATLKTQMVNANNSVSGNDSDITNLQTSLIQTNTNVLANTGKISENSLDIQALESGLNSTNNKVNTNETNIGLLTTDLAQHKTQNINEIGDINTALDMVESKVTTLEIGGGTTGAELTDYIEFNNDRMDTLETEMGALLGLAFKNVDKTGVVPVSDVINNTLIDNSGTSIIFPKGTYKLDKTVVVPANTALFLYGSIFNQTRNIAMFRLEAGAKLFGGVFNGYTSSGFQYDNSGIVGDYCHNAIIRDGAFNGFGNTAIRLKHAKSLLIENCISDRAVYAGIMLFSCENAVVRNNTISNVTIGVNNPKNCYGISLTRDETDDIITDPPCTNCKIQNNYIVNVAPWTGLDMHGGDYNVLDGNTIIDCASGISVAPTDNSSNVKTWCANFNTITNNRIIRSSNTGIILTGINLDKPSICNTIKGNTLYKCGKQGFDYYGGITVCYTDETLVSSNILTFPYPNGIIFDYGNYGFVCNGNSVTNPEDMVITQPMAITCREGKNKGIITGNSCIGNSAPTKTYDNYYGIYVQSGTGNDVVLGVNYVTGFTTNVSTP